jgi:hypothetical protein
MMQAKSLTEMGYEEEIDKILEEEPLGGLGTDAGGNKWDDDNSDPMFDAQGNPVMEPTPEDKKKPGKATKGV